MPTKRTYTLSDAAVKQRRLASQAAQAKRGIKPLRAKDPDIARLIADYDIFAPLPKDAPHSEHQRRAALIRGRQIRNGTLQGSRGGRKRVPRPCPQCKVECDTARDARDHCRKPRPK